MNQYTILGRIGEGAHGIVFKAKHIESGQIVALKKVPLRRLDEGIPNTALREIKALQEIEDNPYIVKLREVFSQGTGFVLVFDYMLSDLSEVTRNTDSPLTEPQVKSYMIMLLKGVAFMHKNNIMHRDLKPANLLISSSGHLKIADFGLARVFQNDQERLYSHQVATRWYRAPELLYGARKYSEGVDLWAVGCIFGELLNRSPLFPGENDIEQLCCVLRVLGTPNELLWPSQFKIHDIKSETTQTIVINLRGDEKEKMRHGADINNVEMVDLPDYNKISFSICQPVPFETVLPDAPKEAIKLIEGILVYSSKKRLSATEALLHPYFFLPPLPAPRSELPRPERSKIFNTHAHQLYDTSPNIPIEESCIDPMFLANGSQLSMFFNQ